jgi:hypothetical protein
MSTTIFFGNEKYINDDDAMSFHFRNLLLYLSWLLEKGQFLQACHYIRKLVKPVMNMVLIVKRS